MELPQDQKNELLQLLKVLVNDRQIICCMSLV